MKEISILGLQEIQKKENVKDIYIFGSVARGEEDEYSDIDVLIIIEECTEEDYVNYKDEFSKLLEVPIEWISLYRKSKIIKMYNKGSYFLWHIKKEGIKLYSKTNEFQSLLNTLPQYSGIHDDLDEYTEILKDIENELREDNICINYELAVLSSLVRNTCIALAYLNNRFDFGRESVIITCIEIYKEQIQFTLNEYNELYKYRLFQTGKLYIIKDGSLDSLKKWIVYEKKLLKIGLEGVGMYGNEKES